LCDTRPPGTTLENITDRKAGRSEEKHYDITRIRRYVAERGRERERERERICERAGDDEHYIAERRFGLDCSRK